MLNKKEFRNIRKTLENNEKYREILIQDSRKTIQLSKKIIYSLHRNDLKTAEKDILEIKKYFNKTVKSKIELELARVARQEYVEALAYYDFVKHKKVPGPKELGVDEESYLSGLCDFTGELVRKAVNDVIKKKYEEVIRINYLIEQIYWEFLHLNLRNGELRKKSDAIKWNLKKVEDIILSLKIQKLV